MKFSNLTLITLLLGLSSAQAAVDTSTNNDDSNIDGKDWREIPVGQNPGRKVTIPDKKDIPRSPSYYPSPATGRFVSTDDKWTEAIKKAQDIVGKMTLVEKVNLTTGLGANVGKCAGTTGSVPRFKIPEICTDNGPLGVGAADLVSSFPPGLSVGTSFNKELAKKRGEAIGK